MCLFCLFHTAVSASRGQQCFFTRHSAAFEIIGKKCQVQCDFARKVLFGALVGEQTAKPGNDSSPMRHGYASPARPLAFTLHSSEHGFALACQVEGELTRRTMCSTGGRLVVGRYPGAALAVYNSFGGQRQVRAPRYRSAAKATRSTTPVRGTSSSAWVRSTRSIRSASYPPRRVQN